MATAKSDQPGALAWILGRILAFVVGYPMMIVFTAIFASPGFFAVNVVMPEATPMFWFAVLGFSIGLMGQVENEDQPNVDDIVENLESMTRREIAVGVLSLCLLASGALSAELAVVSILGVLAAPTAGPIVYLFAVFGPFIDAWIGRKTGVSIGIAGLNIGYALMIFVSLAWNVRLEIARSTKGGVEQVVSGGRVA
jgi:hypothetical protein